MKVVAVLGSLVTLVAATAVSVSSAQAQPAAPELAVPDPATATLDPSTTAWLAIDFLSSTCGSSATCQADLPGVAAALAAARAANATVVYTVHPAPDNMILPDVAPMPTDPVVTATPGDKFYSSDLDNVLKQAGITTLVLTGVSSNVGVLYTAGAAAQRGYTVVVAEDGIVPASDLASSVALWQMLHGPGGNPQNAPLQAKSVTLSRMDLITYQ
jgi:nicotinamidase-related amidase